MESGRLDGEFFFPDLTPTFIKENYLMGLEPMVNGAPVPDSFWLHWIKTSIRHIEKEAQISIMRHSFKREPHDYNVQDYQNFVFIQLFNRPLVRVDKVDAVYPTGTKIFEFPKEWIRQHSESGQIQLVPTVGSLSSILLGQGGGSLPLLAQTLVYLPQFFQIDYTAGFAEGEFPEDIVDAIAKKVAIDVLAQLGDLIYGPGINSVATAIDGVSQTLGIVNDGELGAVFTSRISQYRKDLYGDSTYARDDGGQPGLIKRIKAYYRGIAMVSC